VKGYLVDTNIPSELTREKPDERVTAFLKNANRDTIFLSVMTIGEICKGICAPRQVKSAPRYRIGLILMCAHGSLAVFCQSQKRLPNTGVVWPQPQNIMAQSSQSSMA